MNQKEINNDLKSYMNERKKTKPFWQKVFGRSPRPKEVVQEEIKEELEEKAKVEEKEIPASEQKELHEIESQIEEVDKVERKVEEEIEKEHEGLLKRFFKKMRSNPNKESQQDEEEQEDTPKEEGDNEEVQDLKKSEPVQEPLTKEEMKTLLTHVHRRMLELPPEKLQEFKESTDFTLYKRLLKQYELIK